MIDRLLKLTAFGTILGIVPSLLSMDRSFLKDETVAQEHHPSNNRVRASSIGCPSEGEMLENATVAGITETDLDELDRLVQQNEDTIGEIGIREQTPEGEIIYESGVSQTMVLTPAGVVRCSTFPGSTDDLMNSMDDITYIGGPLDNQSEKK